MLLERRLADQHNLEGSSGRGQVRQLPQLLEGLEGQVLRLINDERHITAHMGLVPEALLHLGPQGPRSSGATGISKRRAIRPRMSIKERRACQSTIVVSCGAATRVR